MKQTKITRSTLSQSVRSTLSRCRFELQQASDLQRNAQLVRDLTIAVRALELICSELSGGLQRPKGQRSAQFTRYVIDETPHVAMASDLRDEIVRIEDLYSRY